MAALLRVCEIFQSLLLRFTFLPEKRQMDLLRAFSDAELSGWKLAIVGRIDHKNKYADLLTSEAALAENVVMAGFQSGEPLRQL